ncbi:MAG: hypothetical protein KDA65_11215 [Planctomycetaceae bacterium]|nr:hypothetical protein [Planctomycetaceae bacterium]
MKLKRVFILFAILLLLVGGGVGLAIWLTLQTPPEYARRVDIPVTVREENLKKVEEKKTQLIKEVETKPEWQFNLSELETNSWLASQEFRDEVAVHLPPEIKDPRVQFKAGELILAFRVTHHDFQGVVMVPLKIVSLTPDEIQIRIEQVTTGLLPFPWDELLEESLSEHHEALPVGVTWNTEEENENGILITVSLDSLAELQWQLDEVRIESGNLHFKGSRSVSTDEKTLPEIFPREQNVPSEAGSSQSEEGSIPGE